MATTNSINSGDIIGISHQQPTMNFQVEAVFHELINPLNSDKLDDSLPEFLQNILSKEDYVVTTISMIGHKMQSPLELEALTACHIIEFLCRDGGHLIQKHVAMYKFLNDCIRVLSPKYLGKRTKPNVKARIIELLYCWSEALPHLPKLRDAYQMLRRNKIIKADPPYNDRIMLPPASPADRPSYLDENRELLLKSLLASKNPEDHARANKLIQKLIKEDDEKVERQAKRIEAIDQALDFSGELIKLVEVVPQSSQGNLLSELERRRIDELYVACTRLRPTIFRMASENDQNETELTKILSCNDQLSKAIQLFDTNMGSVKFHPVSGSMPAGSTVHSQVRATEANLLDFSDEPTLEQNNTDVLTSSLLDLGLEELVDNNHANKSTPSNKIQISKTYELSDLQFDAHKSVTIYDKNNLRCLATPCQDNICCFTLLNNSANSLKNYQLQLSVMKNTSCHIQDPDKNCLPAFNPIMPSGGINSIVQFKSEVSIIDIRFRLIFEVNDGQKNDRAGPG